MNYQHLFNHLETVSEENKKYHKEIHNILYFNNEKFLENPDFLNHENNDKLFFDININNNTKEEEKKIETNFKNFSQDIDTLFNIQTFNVSNKNDTLIDCILEIIDYKNINGRVELFQKMLRDFDSLKLFKKFNLKSRKICKKKEIRDLLLSYDDENEIMRYFLSNYLSVNLILLENEKYKLYCENDNFEPFKTTIMIYKYDNKYYFLSSKNNNSLFTSDDEFVLRLYKLHNENNDNIEDNTTLEIEEMLFNINLEPEKKEIKDVNIKIEKEPINTEPIKNEEVVQEKINLKLMKVTELKKLCKTRGLKRYSKLKKKELIELLEK